MSETIINPSSAAPPDPTDQGRTETFCRYLARRFVANKGFGFGTVPEAEKLIAASDIVLTQNRDAPFTILCLIDHEANPARTFDLSLPELEIIGRDCMKYADVIEIFGRPEIPVAIRVIEVGAISDARWQHLKTLTSNTPDARYHAAALAVDPAKGEVRWNTRLDRPERTFIEDVLRAQRLPASPRESDADFNPLVAIAPPSFPILTTGILAVLVAVFAAEIGFGVDAWSGPLRPSVKTLVAFGGLSQNLVLQSGEWYRLFSAPFLHADAFHLAMNAVALLLAGRVLERLIGRAWFGAVYAVAALCGAWLSMLLNPSTARRRWRVRCDHGAVRRNAGRQPAFPAWRCPQTPARKRDGCPDSIAAAAGERCAGPEDRLRGAFRRRHRRRGGRACDAQCLVAQRGIAAIHQGRRRDRHCRSARTGLSDDIHCTPLPGRELRPVASGRGFRP
jgi:membrane associated rhomboid family serine protease